MATILIVDDHAINRQFLLTLLGYGGHRLLEAAEGTTALHLVRTEHPDLVITDILMPNMDGYEFVTHIRAHPSVARTPVIFYTASYRAREARSMAQACGVHWVLSKPSEPELILRTVQEALGTTPPAEEQRTTQLSASIDAEQFSAINDQLRTYIGELGVAGECNGAASFADADSTAALAERGNLRTIAQKLSGSLDSLQEVSLRLTRLIELGLDLAAERDPGRMLEILCRAAHGICAARYAAVAVLNDDEASLGYCFTRGMESDVVGQLRSLPPQSGVLGRLLRERVPSRMNSLDGNPQTLGLPASHPRVHCFLGVPLASKERTYGWLYLADKIDAGEFSEVDEQVAATIASQMAAAYENLILYDEVHQHRAQLQMEVVERKHAQEALRRNLRARTVMAECNRVLVHADDEIALLNEMCLTIVETGGYPMVWIGYAATEDGSGPLRLAAQAGLPHAYQSRLTPAGAGALQTHTDGFMTSAQSHVPVRIAPDLAGMPAFADWQKLVAEQGYRASLSLPLRENGRVFGVLTIYEGETQAFGKEQIDMLEQLAEDIGYGAGTLRTRRAREQAERSLSAAQDKLTGILSSIDNIVWSLSEKELLYISPIAEKVFGYPLEEFYKNKDLWFDAIHPEDQPQVRSMGALHEQQGAVTREYRILRPDGNLRWLEDRTRAVRDAHGALLRVDGVASDITERKEYEARIEYLATHDPLTNLANRNLLQDRLAQAIAVSRRTKHMLALLFVDLDRFKDINDSFGHALGDKLLIAVAARLRSVVRDVDTVARPGGDEFIILLTDIVDADSVNHVAGKLLDLFSTTFALGELELHIGASIGVSVYPNDGQDIETLLRNTDTAMYRVKERGGNGLQLYSADMSVRAMQRMELENGLHHALEHQEFELYYQPKLDLQSGRIIGAEALIRWHHPELGLVLPANFISIAEETGIIAAIGEWVLRSACAQAKAWQLEGLPAVCVSVNLSARQFRNEGLVKLIGAILDEAGLEARYLELELTESLVMHNAELFIARLQELKALGVQLSIDDFGTGYSSLSYLKRFPLDRLKIDQSFVRDITADADDAAITGSVISLGHSLNLKVIAEGVETREQLAFLRERGCDEMQGFLFSEALPAPDFAALVREGRTLDA